jgi:predicted Zn-dependent peptidase
MRPWRRPPEAALALGCLLGMMTAPARAQIKVPNLPLNQSKLDNGLRIILVPNHSLPVIAIDVAITSAAAMNGRDERDSPIYLST